MIENANQKLKKENSAIFEAKRPMLWRSLWKEIYSTARVLGPRRALCQYFDISYGEGAGGQNRAKSPKIEISRKKEP